MPFDRSTDPLPDPLVSRPRRAPPAVMLAGVAGACALGAAAGLWARPSTDDVNPTERLVAAAPKPQSEAARQIVIRVDGRPEPAAAAPVGPEPAVAPPPVVAPAPAPAPAPELMAPKAPPQGLVRVHAVEPERLADAPAPTRATRDTAERRARAEAEARAARREAEAAAARMARRERARLAEAAEAHAREAAERRAEKQAMARAAKLAEEKAAARLKVRFAEEKKAARAKAEAQRLAEQKRKSAVKLAATPVRTKAAARCASPDPGAALACSDPALSAAERQLLRAYRQAEAAGVPPERLERQQQRWLTVRANAARKAPWAVHDIYLARIAELQDQTRQASHGE